MVFGGCFSYGSWCVVFLMTSLRLPELCKWCKAFLRLLAWFAGLAQNLRAVHRAQMLGPTTCRLAPYCSS